MLIAAAVFLLVFGLPCLALITSQYRTHTRKVRARLPVLHDVHEAAFLTGGPARVVDTALAALEADGRIRVADPGVVATGEGTAAPGTTDHPVHRAVLTAIERAPNGSLAQLRGAVMRDRAVQAIGDRLASRGLLQRPSRGRETLRIWGGVLAVVSIVATVVAGVLTGMSHEVDWARTEVPLILLALPVTLTGLVGGITLAIRCGRLVTRDGRLALDTARTRHGTTEDPATLLALRGARALPDTPARTVLVAAAAAPVLLLAAPAAAGAAPVAAQWCGATTGYAGSDGGSAGTDGGGGGDGDGGGGDGGGCGGCGGCGCG
ncbi:TIGR04222 domain-containing membrane protein [Streptomyces sp. NPDC000594]|uniref:TIGR04222 domain-containing membrane protein n=1 Tax=Streptomyces sp. NPDC000594 TaxID=3154261 RepID=UPI00331BE681